MKNTAIVLAAGKGTRMGTKVAKQFLELGGKPILVYSLETMERSPEISQIILVTGKDQMAACRDLVQRYGIHKTALICEGGCERYESVWRGLDAIKKTEEFRKEKTNVVLIHDGARPFLSEEIVARVCRMTLEYQACVVGMPVKDTIKITDTEGNIVNSPNRSVVWQAQTPQAFAFSVVYEAYRQLMQERPDGITDDAMVVERYSGIKVRMVSGSYENIKITTPEDLKIAESFLA